jgi:hypothetical protein
MNQEQRVFLDPAVDLLDGESRAEQPLARHNSVRIPGEPTDPALYRGGFTPHMGVKSPRSRY